MMKINYRIAEQLFNIISSGVYLYFAIQEWMESMESENRIMVCIFTTFLLGIQQSFIIFRLCLYNQRRYDFHITTMYLIIHLINSSESQSQSMFEVDFHFNSANQFQKCNYIFFYSILLVNLLYYGIIGLSLLVIAGVSLVQIWYSSDSIVNREGLTQQEFESLPNHVVTAKESQNMKSSYHSGIHNHQTNDCAICLSVFEENELMIEIVHCKHIFHSDCIRVWFKNSVLCPYCRNDVRKALQKLKREKHQLQHAGHTILDKIVDQAEPSFQLEEFIEENDLRNQQQNLQNIQQQQQFQDINQNQNNGENNDNYSDQNNYFNNNNHHYQNYNHHNPDNQNDVDERNLSQNIFLNNNQNPLINNNNNIHNNNYLNNINNNHNHNHINQDNNVALNQPSPSSNPLQNISSNPQQQQNLSHSRNSSLTDRNQQPQHQYLQQQHLQEDNILQNQLQEYVSLQNNNLINQEFVQPSPRYPFQDDVLTNSLQIQQQNQQQFQQHSIFQPQLPQQNQRIPSHYRQQQQQQDQQLSNLPQLINRKSSQQSETSQKRVPIRIVEPPSPRKLKLQQQRKSQEQQNENKTGPIRIVEPPSPRRQKSKEQQQLNSDQLVKSLNQSPSHKRQTSFGKDDNKFYEHLEQQHQNYQIQIRSSHDSFHVLNNSSHSPVNYYADGAGYSNKNKKLLDEFSFYEEQQEAQQIQSVLDLQKQPSGKKEIQQ